MSGVSVAPVAASQSVQSRAIWPKWLQGTPLRVASVAGLLLLWQLAASTGLVSGLFLPAPAAVIRAAIQIWKTGELQKNILASLARVAQGFVLGGTVGTFVGLWFGQNRVARMALRPILELIRPIPGLAWAPLILIWFGIGETGKIVLIAYATFFPVFTSTLDGVQRAPAHVVQAARSLGARPSQMFLRVLFPSTLPHILTGLSIGMGQAFGIVVAAEMIAGTEGMGWMIADARSFFRTDLVILGMVLIGTFGFICVQAIVSIRRRLLSWCEPELRK